MKKFTLLLVIFVSVFQLATFAEDADTAWKSKYEATLGLSQTTFTNWATGGDNAFSTNALLNIYKNYAKGKVSWNNYLGLAYGVNVGQIEPKVRKTSDKINFVTKGGIYAWKNWDYAGLFEFRSQFAEGFNYPNTETYVSKFMAPGYFQLSIGLNYKPVSYFNAFISPIGARLTVVNDTSLTNTRDPQGNIIGAFGVIGDNSTLWQIGGSVNITFKKDIMKNVNLMSKLDLFSDYRNNPQKLVVGWENNLLMKVNKYISLSLTTMLVRDPNVPFIDSEGNPHAPRTQFRETFSLGISYSLER